MGAPPHSVQMKTHPSEKCSSHPSVQWRSLVLSGAWKLIRADVTFEDRKAPRLLCSSYKKSYRTSRRAWDLENGFPRTPTACGTFHCGTLMEMHVRSPLTRPALMVFKP